jgi:FkbM family methyltransferase
MRRMLRPGDVFVDCGANVGYFTLLAARRVRPSGRVLSFEPSPGTRERCAKNVRLNGYTNVDLYPYAVSDVESESVLFQPERGCDLASLRPHDERSETGQEHVVTTVRLDRIVPADLAARIRLIKIDVEGADLLALRGLEGILRQPRGPAVICEINDGFLRQMGGSEEELLEYMFALHYSAYSFERLEFRRLSAAQGGHYDALFMRSSEPLPVSGRGTVKSATPRSGNSSHP